MKKKIEVWAQTEKIKEMYKQGISSEKIARSLNVRKQLILIILRKAGIDTSRPVSFYKQNKTFEELYGVNRAKEMKEKLSKIHKGKPKSEEHKRKIRESQVGKLISLETKTKQSLAQLRRKARDGSTLLPEARSKIIRYYKTHHSPAWIDGRSFEPYPITFNKEFKNLVRLRDNFCCLNCGISEQKHLILFNQKLHIHHIDYNKKNTCLANCCALCIKCNSLANKNRHEWTIFYQEKLSRIHSYQYENNEEVLLNVN